MRDPLLCLSLASDPVPMAAGIERIELKKN